MREIKFRIWDNLKKKWVSNKEIWRMKTDEFGIGEIHPNTFYWKQHPDGLTYQQYTGLKDKNGKDTYIGDIVKWGKADIGCELVEVRWSGEDHDSHPCIIYNDSYSQGCGFEIVGNIFENPELLKL